MKEFLFSGESKTARFVFQRLLNGMDSPFRKRFNDPQRLITASGICAGQTVLEVGCGSGFFTPALSDAVGENGFVQSIDLHPMSVETVSRKMKELGTNSVNVSQADAHQTDFSDASFDAIILYGVVPAPVIAEDRLSVELYRLLKTGGVLAVWTVVPFWYPSAFLKAAPFTHCGKVHGVHRLHKK